MTDRILAIGDIHGCIRNLLELLAQVRPEPSDTLVFLGDYLDRGPDPRRVIETLLELQRTLPRVVCLMGNHEVLFLNFYREGKDEELYFINGGMQTLASYGLSVADARAGRGFPEDHLAFISSLPLLYETPDYLFVHGGLKPGVPLTEQSSRDLLWIRYDFIDSDWDFGKTVVFGHTPLSEPLLEANKIGIDTGAAYGGKLTCIELPSRRLFQA